MSRRSKRQREEKEQRCRELCHCVFVKVAAFLVSLVSLQKKKKKILAEVVCHHHPEQKIVLLVACLCTVMIDPCSKGPRLKWSLAGAKREK